MGDILITIITVSLDAASTIRGTIESVERYRSERTEYIIVDGGSTDGTVEIINEYIKSVDVLVTGPDAGIYDAMNKGVALASGRWVLFLGADDLLKLDISEIESKLEGDKCYYGSVVLRSNGEVYDGRFNQYKILRKNICQQSVIYPVSLLRSRKFDVRYKIAADYDMNLYLFGSRYKSVEFIDAVVADFDESGVSSRKSDVVFRKDFLLLFFKYFPFYLFPLYPIARLHYYMIRIPYHIRRLMGS